MADYDTHIRRGHPSESPRPCSRFTMLMRTDHSHLWSHHRLCYHRGTSKSSAHPSPSPVPLSTALLTLDHSLTHALSSPRTALNLSMARRTLQLAPQLPLHLRPRPHPLPPLRLHLDDCRLLLLHDLLPPVCRERSDERGQPRDLVRLLSYPSLPRYSPSCELTIFGGLGWADSMFMTWVFWLSGAAAITQALGGGLNCGYVTPLSLSHRAPA